MSARSLPLLLALALALAASVSVISGSAAPQPEQQQWRGRRRAPPLFPQLNDQEGEDRALRAPRTPSAPVSSGWPFKPIQVNLEIPGRGDSGPVPVVLVAVPVPVPENSAGCAAAPQKTPAGRPEYEEFAPVQRPPSRPPVAAAPSRPRGEPDDERRPARLPPPLPDARFPPVKYVPEEDDTALPPRPQPVDSSRQLVEEFREQIPRAPELPPMLLSGFDASERAPVPVDPAASAQAGAPLDLAPPVPPPVAPRGRSRAPEPAGKTSPPQYNYAAMALMRAQLTVPRADYTEPYTVWFEPYSGSARVDFHDGSATTFRSRTADGRVRRAVVWVQRSGSGEVRRCSMVTSAPRDADAQHPALPALSEFTYAGDEETSSGPVELWTRTVKGRAGEQGAARGEALTTRHEMRLARVDGAALPLRYKVSVDSSVLGADCDGYEHVYQYESAQPMPPDFFHVELDKLCDTVENLNAESPEHVARLEPLREFTLPHRDQRHDRLFDSYQAQYARQYADQTEEAVRKNLLMQSTRFVTSGNRQGGTSELGATLLADRLQVEVRRIMGGTGAAAALAQSPGRDSFPYSREQVRAQERRLPSGFDWRARGGVSPVGFQGFQCASCWAFAVSGAVEGALFRRTRRLVPLSYQCLVDCAHPFGGNGCVGTWPSYAYNYVQERGLPALDEYPPYKEKVDKCVEQSVPSQTRISGHVNVTTNSVPALKVAIKKHAPNVVIVDAECKSFVLHMKGVLYDDRCGKQLSQLHHAVLAVGWGERRGEPHFILKNSWSAKWGEKGFIRVHARSNTCGVLTMPSYPLLEERDVGQPLRAGGARLQRHRPAATDDLEDDADDSNVTNDATDPDYF